MRGVPVAVFLLGAMSIAVMTAADDGAQRTAIQAVLDAHGVAWTKGDAVAAAAVMTGDAATGFRAMAPFMRPDGHRGRS